MIQRIERENLKATAVSQDWTFPASHAVQPAQPCDGFVPRPQSEVIGIAQNHMGTRRSDLIDRDSLDGPLSSNGHEAGRLDGTVGRNKNTATGHRGAVAVGEFK